MTVGNSYRVIFSTYPLHPPVETGGYSQATPYGVRENGS